MVRQRTWIPGPPGPPQHTFTNLHFKDYGGPEEALGYICYQTVQGEFCVLLDTFEDSKHLIWALHDVVTSESAFAGTTSVAHTPSAIQDLYDYGIIQRHQYPEHFLKYRIGAQSPKNET